MATTSHRMSVDEYQRLVFSDQDRQWELLDGQLREKPGKSWDHHQIVALLSHLLMCQIDRGEYRVFAEGRVRWTAATIFIPDLLVVPAAFGREFRGKPGTLAIFAEPLPLIVEVWSALSDDYDVDAKLPVYKQRGDREIWRIHPYERTLNTWRRQPDGTYDETIYREGVITPEALPGVSINLAELFDD